MSAFKPVNPDHAIAAVAFAMNFDKPLNDSDITKAKQIEPAVKDFLPGTASIGGRPQGFLLPGMPLPSLPTGIVFQRVKPDATPAWMLTAQQNFILAQCMEYTRWTEVWGRVRPWLNQLYRLVKRQELSLKSISLQYQDQFSAAKPLDNDILEKIFRRDSQYLPQRTFYNKELWHISQGWYLPTEEPIPGRNLNVLNIATRDMGDSIMLMIDHMFRYEMDDGDPPLFNQNDPLIDRIMEYLHSQNKSLLRELLSAQMAHSIRLDC